MSVVGCLLSVVGSLFVMYRCWAGFSPSTGPAGFSPPTDLPQNEKDVMNVTNVTIVTNVTLREFTTEFTGYTEKYTERGGGNVMNVTILTRNGVSSLARSKKSV